MPKLVQETSRLHLTKKAAVEAKDSGRMLVQFISPGWGTSGYYSKDVLEAAATDKVIPAGTHMYADHPTEVEEMERPIRSIKDLMAVTSEDARVAENGALVGEIEVVPAWRDLVDTVKDSIGVSIRGSAVAEAGQAEGKSGDIIESLMAPVLSVDFVTRPGRGGKVLSVLESARATTRAVARGVSEATVNDTRDSLHTVLRDEYGSEDVWIWVRDFDDTTVWFEIESGDDAGVYGQPYTETDGAVTLTGDREEVRVVTTYVPAARSDSTTTATESKEIPMGKIQVEEAEHTAALEKAGRVDVLESENATLKAENAQLKEADAARDRADQARDVVVARAEEASVEFTPLETKGLLAELPVKEDGSLDEETFTTTVDEAAAAKKKTDGAGSVFGFGGDPTPIGEGGELSAEDLEKSISEAFGHAPAMAGTQVKEA